MKKFLNAMKQGAKKAPTYLGLFGGIAAQAAVVASAINPRAGAVLTAAALIASSVGESIVRVQAATKESD